LSKNGHNHRVLIVQKSFYLNSRVSSRKLCLRKFFIEKEYSEPFAKVRKTGMTKVIMQGKLFHHAYFVLQCLSLGADVNSRRMSKPYMGSIFHITNQWNILVIGKYYVNYQNYQNLMILTFSDTKRTLMHLFMFTNSAQRELVSISTHSIRNWN